jgi:hypothetical protein
MIGNGMEQEGQRAIRTFDDDTPPSDPEEFWEFWEWWWNVRLPELRQECAVHRAEIRRAREERERRSGRRFQVTVTF